MNEEWIGMVEELAGDPAEQEIARWVRCRAGSNNNRYFRTDVEGAMMLQQVPEEYAALCRLVRSASPRHYLEVGVGCGGSWLAMTYLNRDTLESSHAVDNLSAGPEQSLDGMLSLRDHLAGIIPDARFYAQDSGSFFEHCRHRYDVIFIDGDHSYAGVRNDYTDALRYLSPGGMMVFHDIVSSGAPGVAHFWGEAKGLHRHVEIVHSDTCGIGVIYP